MTVVAVSDERPTDLAHHRPKSATSPSLVIRERATGFGRGSAALKLL
jgi:hypothetical protein